MSVSIILLWIVTTFIVGSLAGILGKRYGLIFPVALVSALIIMANIFANKIVSFGMFTIPAGVIVFSMIFFITDLISEVWGKKAAQQTVWAGFFSSLVLIISTYIVIHWQSAPFAIEASQKFSDVLSLTPRITFASLVAYIISQHHDIWAYHFWKKTTKGKHLWIRNNFSTIISQGIDSLIFVTIAFSGIYPLFPLIMGQWVVKTIIAIIDTPFLYATLAIMKRVKQIPISNR